MCAFLEEIVLLLILHFFMLKKFIFLYSLSEAEKEENFTKNLFNKRLSLF